jgi:hypothetical protein
MFAMRRETNPLQRDLVMVFGIIAGAVLLGYFFDSDTPRIVGAGLIVTLIVARDRGY